MQRLCVRVCKIYVHGTSCLYSVVIGTTVEVQDIFTAPKENPVPVSTLSHSPFPPPLATMNLLPISIDLPFLGVSFTGSQTAFACSVWLPSPRTPFSRLAHGAAWVSLTLLLWVNTIPLCG